MGAKAGFARERELTERYKTPGEGRDPWLGALVLKDNMGTEHLFNIHFSPVIQKVYFVDINGNYKSIFTKDLKVSKRIIEAWLTA